MKKLQEQIDQKVKEYEEEIVNTAREWVRVKSVESSPQSGQPFGPGVDQALQTALESAGQLGLRQENIDGYAGHIEIGQGEEILGILCHLDVVPEGSDWSYPPYGAEIHDGKIYGRGIQDDKGPAVAALYALKIVDELGIDLHKRVRLILGTDEESGWEGMDYYKQQVELPDLGFSPDASYPVIYAEKGIIIFNVEESFSGEEDPVILSIKGGNAPNMVPDYCEAVLEERVETNLKQKLAKYKEKTGADLQLVKENNRLLLKSRGVSAHGSRPFNGVNAISQLIQFLNTLDLPDTEITRFLQLYDEKIGSEYYGESLGCDFEDESGKLIFNPGMIELTQQGMKLVVNIRYPVTYKLDTVMERIQNQQGVEGFDFEITEHKQPLYVSREDPLVVDLMKVYREITGDDRQPMAIGGGTYARVLDRGVAFGPLFPGKPELAHQKDEYMEIKDLYQNVRIYARAIAELAGRDVNG